MELGLLSLFSLAIQDLARIDMGLEVYVVASTMDDGWERRQHMN